MLSRGQGGGADSSSFSVQTIHKSVYNKHTSENTDALGLGRTSAPAPPATCRCRGHNTTPWHRLRQTRIALFVSDIAAVKPGNGNEQASRQHQGQCTKRRHSNRSESSSAEPKQKGDTSLGQTDWQSSPGWGIVLTMLRGWRAVRQSLQLPNSMHGRCMHLSGRFPRSQRAPQAAPTLLSASATRLRGQAR